MSTKLGTLTLDLVAKIGNFVEPIKKASDTTQRESKRIESSVNSVTKAIVGLGVTALAGLTVGAVIEQADAYTQMAARIRNATKDTDEYNQVQNRLLSTANGTYRALSEAQEVYLGLSGGLKELGYNTKQVLDISDSMSYSFVHNATSADKAQSAMSAYGKVLDKGKVDADSWFSIMAATPNVLDDVAKATGKSSQEVRKLGAEGKLAAEDLHKGFLQSLETNKALADNMENSFADGLVSVKNGFEVLVGKANMATGATSTLASGLVTVGEVLALASENLDVLAVAGGTAAVVLALKMTPAVIMGGKAFALSSIESVKYQIALARMAAQAGGTSTALTIMGGVARGALAILGGPIGLVLTVASVAASYALFRDNTKESTVSLRENNETVEEAIKKYGELDKIKRAAQLVEEREKLEDLTSAYDNANSKLISYTLKVVRNAEMTSDQAKAFSKLVMDYKSGKITLEQLSDSISKSTALSGDEKDAFIKKAASVRDASTEVGKHKNLVLQMIDRDKQFIRNNDDVTNAIDRRTTAISRLSKKEQDVYNSIGQSVQRESYINNNMAQGKSREWAEYFADKRSEASIPYTEKLTEHMYLQFETGYKLQQQIEKREETEKKIAEGQKKKAEFAEKNYSYTKSELAMLERVAKITSENNLNGIGAKYGIPENLLAAVMAQESKGVVNAKSESGAIGPFQTTGVYRKQYGMSVADSYDVKKAADIAAKDLAKSFEVFGNWTDAVTAYNAGVGGTKSLNSRGFTTSDAKTKEAKGYAPLVDKWLTGLNGSSTKGSGLTGKEAVASIKELGEYWENAEQLRKESLERQKTVSEMYLSEGQRLFAENKGAKKEIQEAFVNNPEAIDRYLKLQEIAYQKDLVEFKKAQEQKRVATYEAFYNPLAEMQMIGMNATAQATLSPMEYQKWQVGSEQQAGYSQLGDSFLSAQKAINDNELLTETERYAQLETVYEQYLQAKSALSVQYAKEEDDLRKQQKMQQLDLWGSVLSQAQNTFAQLTQSVQNSAGEQSGIYKTMFAMQKAFTIASSTMAAYNAYTTAFADPSAMTLAQKFAGGAAVMSALMPAITTISSLSLDGMAHDGIDNVPKEGTWLLDKGERVVDSRTNADLKNYLANGRGSGGDTTIQVNVTDSGVSTQSSGDQKQLGDMIGNAVRAVIRQEKRQGGLLAK